MIWYSICPYLMRKGVQVRTYVTYNMQPRRLKPRIRNVWNILFFFQVYLDDLCSVLLLLVIFFLSVFLVIRKQKHSTDFYHLTNHCHPIQFKRTGFFSPSFVPLPLDYEFHSIGISSRRNDHNCIHKIYT